MPASKFRREWNALSAAQKLKINAQFADAVSALIGPVEYHKQVLRRLGAPRVLEGDESLLQVWAAARNAGFSDEEYEKLTPRELFAVLEQRAFALDNSRASGSRIQQQDEHGRRLRKLERALRDKTIDTFCADNNLGRTTFYQWKAREWEKLSGTMRTKIESIMDSLPD